MSTCRPMARRWPPRSFLHGFNRFLFGWLLLFAIQFDLGRLLDNFLKHLPRNASLRRPTRFPDFRRLLGQNIGEIAVAFHAPGGEVDDVDVTGPLVAML